MKNIETLGVVDVVEVDLIETVSESPGLRPSPDGGLAAALPLDEPPGGPRDFHPGWFGAVMGTAIVAVTAYLNPGHVSRLASTSRVVGQTMAIVAIALAIVLLIPYIARMILHPHAAWADLRNPAVGALYGTLPGGILVIAATYAAIGPSWYSVSSVRDVVAILDWVGIPLAFLTSVIFAYLLFERSEIVPESVNGGWFIPPVVNIIVPLVLAPLVPGVSATSARTLMLMAYGFWGMGFVLYVLVLSMLYQRLTLHPLPHAGLAPSLWIGLGPVGVGALALLKMSAVGAVLFGSVAPSVGLVSEIAATMLWGFGAWWLIAAALLLVHYLRSGPLPYGIGWWGFTFPLGAFTAATLTLASAWQLGSLQWIGAGLFVLLCVFWLIVAGRTIWSLVSRRTLA